jgi:hypothetical protein
VSSIQQFLCIVTQRSYGSLAPQFSLGAFPVAMPQADTTINLTPDTADSTATPLRAHTESPKVVEELDPTAAVHVASASRIEGTGAPPQLRNQPKHT